jgi:hypothetical protein
MGSNPGRVNKRPLVPGVINMLRVPTYILIIIFRENELFLN